MVTGFNGYEHRGYATTESRFNRIMLEMQNLTQGVNADPEAKFVNLLKNAIQLTRKLKRFRKLAKLPYLVKILFETRSMICLTG